MSNVLLTWNKLFGCLLAVADFIDACPCILQFFCHFGAFLTTELTLVCLSRKFVGYKLVNLQAGKAHHLIRIGTVFHSSEANTVFIN